MALVIRFIDENTLIYFTINSMIKAKSCKAACRVSYSLRNHGSLHDATSEDHYQHIT